MKIDVAYEIRAKRPSLAASLVMDHFGIDFEAGRHVIAAGWEIPLVSGDVVCFSGPSGSGKSSLMRACAAQLPDVIDMAAIPLDDRILIEALKISPREGMSLLAQCGLGEARLMLRTAHELSDGQRYRFRLALALARRPAWILADEFTAALDRPLARVIAFNLRRAAVRQGAGLLLAGTHDDILADLAPTLHVRCAGNGPPVIERNDCKKKESSVSPRGCGSPAVPARTGRISLGGITGAIGSESSAS